MVEDCAHPGHSGEGRTKFLVDGLDGVYGPHRPKGPFYPLAMSLKAVYAAFGVYDEVARPDQTLELV